MEQQTPGKEQYVMQSDVCLLPPPHRSLTAARVLRKIP